MTRDDLTMDEGQKEVHYTDVNIYKTFSDGAKTVETRTVQASSREELELKLATLPDQLRNQYENPSGISVKVKPVHIFSMTKEEFKDYIRRDNADTERQIDKWML